jgi:ABC-type Fe3+ transport system substrate-binding protein
LSPESGATSGQRHAAGIILALLLTLIAPFLLRSADTPLGYDRRLVILSPHNERVRREIGHAFTRYWKARTGEAVYLDWRIPGGSSEIAMFLKSEFSGAFQYEWEHRAGKAWTHAIAGAFANPRIHAPPAAAGAEAEARRHFLESAAGIGVDLLFGGGSYDFQQQADAGYLVARNHDGRFGPGSVIDRHPDWFTAPVMPASVSGEPFRDRDARWIGVVLASFGIVYNRDVLRRLGIGFDLAQWHDLADPRLAGQVALSDPTKSGSVAKAFELMIQQQMHEAVSRLTGRLPRDKAESAGIRSGWDKGLRLIQRISANSRYFTDSAAKIALEVSRGDAAAGMAIDSYGRATEDYVRRPDGSSRVGFVPPRGGTSVSVDSIAMVRGAPDPELATAFIEFVLSPEGQTLWAFRPGTPGGPVDTALRRPPIRKDVYTDANRRYMSDSHENPYAQAESFVYRPDWTAPAFGAIRFLVRVMCADTHLEQKRAWQALIQHGFPPEAVDAFHDLDGVGYEDAIERIGPLLKGKDKLEEVRLARELADAFRERYERAYRLAVGTSDE